MLITASGLYRDTFSDQIEMIDRAVLMVSELNETNQTNYVRHNSLVMYDALIDAGYDNSSAFGTFKIQDSVKPRGITDRSDSCHTCKRDLG